MSDSIQVDQWIHDDLDYLRKLSYDNLVEVTCDRWYSCVQHDTTEESSPVELGNAVRLEQLFENANSIIVGKLDHLDRVTKKLDELWKIAELLQGGGDYAESGPWQGCRHCRTPLPKEQGRWGEVYIKVDYDTWQCSNPDCPAVQARAFLERNKPATSGEETNDDGM